MPHNEIAIPVKSPHRAARSLSISSDRTSTTGHGAPLSPPLTVRPEAGFIAASAASQIVTNDHDSRAETWFDQYGIEPSGETAMVAPPALQLVNRFLDQLLFSFLALAKSTSLSALRPAVMEVLKTKLATAAIQGADQELHEYLGGSEDEELLSLHDGGHDRNWDLELVWKRTRLRCMVYSSLGDMEEEDEDYYTEEEQLGSLTSDGPYAPGVVSPAVAIFLTSVLEFTGEQVLIVAGQSAYNRLRAKLERQEKEGTHQHGDIADRVVVEELDMERVAMDRTIGRLWRGWKKRVRTPANSEFGSRTITRESLSQSIIGISTQGDVIPEEKRQSVAQSWSEQEQAASIPLPISSHDIREIEIPGLAVHSDDEDADIESEGEEFMPSKRPQSLMHFDDDESWVGDYRARQPTFLSAHSRTRSHSLPSPARARFSAKQAVKDVANEDTQAVNGSETSEEGEARSEESIKTSQNLAPIVKAASQHEASSDESELDMPIQGATVEDDNAKKPESTEDNKRAGLITNTLAGAAAIASTAVAGIASAAKGEAPQTDLKDDESDLEELAEEPQIMTSSRISYSGRNTPDIYAQGSKLSRPQSVQSVRMIDVASTTSSRSSSPDNVEGLPARAASLSRSSSLRSPDQVIRVTSPISRLTNASPILRSGSSSSARRVGQNLEPVILEEKEVFSGPHAGPRTPIPSEVAENMHSLNMGQSYVEQEQLDRKSPDVRTPMHVPLHLAQPPMVRQIRGPTSHPSDEQNLSPRPSVPPRSSSVESATPPLPPLQEAHEDYDEGSDTFDSYTPSNYSRSASGDVALANTSLASGALTTTNYREQNPLRSNPAMNAKSSPPRSTGPREDSRRQVEYVKPTRPSNGSSTSPTTSHKLKPTRTSEDSGSPVVEDKGQSFEQLMRSDQTIQYTLTPQNMRNIESPDSLRQVITPTLLSNGFDNHRAAPRSRSSSSNRNVSVQTNMPLEQLTNGTLNKQVQRTGSLTGSKRSPHPVEARDARVDRDSVNDFADFIRSTGPVNGSVNNTPRPLNIHKGTHGTPRNASGSLPKTTEPSKLPRRSESSAGRSKLQARDAIVPRGDISDLIDFVRSGPQLEKDTHRIPRTVAPFRSTMDSDVMANAVGGKAVDASLPDRYSQVTTAPSVDGGSINSRSALLNGNQARKTVATKNSHDFDDEDMMPKRKTRRVRDPYAIDLSDEDEDEDLDPYQKPKQPAIKEESLADFLKNVPPPKESTVQPIYAPEVVKNVKKKSSTHSFRSRFSGKKDSASNIPANKNSDPAPKVPSHTQTPVQSVPYDAARNGSYTASVQTGSRMAPKSYQPRDAGYNASSRTGDLASFLRDSEPPAGGVGPRGFAEAGGKEEGSLKRMFGRRKLR